MLLAIDTSTDYSGLALYDGAEVVAETIWRSARHHTEQVAAQLDLLCRQVAVDVDELSAVAVATGPGSWAGLRVGMSFAKAIAVARGVPIVGIPTAAAWAWSQPESGDVLVAIRLGRGRYAVTDFPAAIPACAADPAATVYSLQDLPVRSALYVGDLDAELRRHIGTVGRCATPLANVRRPAAIAELAWVRLAEGGGDDLVGLEPIYLSSPVQSGHGT